SVDSSLLAEWEALAAGDPEEAARVAASAAEGADPVLERERPITANERAFTTMVRNAVYRRVGLLDREDYGALAALDSGQGGAGAAAEWAAAAEPYWQEYTDLGTGNEARGAQMAEISKSDRTWQVTQILSDPEGDNDWRMHLEVDIPASAEAGEPVTKVTGLGPLT